MRSARTDQTRSRMAEMGFDYLIVPSPENMYYLAGYDGWSFYLHQCLVISRHSDRIIWVGRGSDLHVANLCELIGNGNTFTYPDNYLHSDEHNPYDYVAQVLREIGWTSGTIAVPMDAYFFSPAAYNAIERGLPGCAIVADGSLVNWLRVIKTEDEVALMREAANIGAAALLAGAQTVKPGIARSVTAGRILDAQTGAAIGADGGYPAIMPLLIDGMGPARPHDTWSAAPYPASGPIILEIAGVHQRYHAPMARTVFLGNPDPLHEAALTAQVACMDAIGDLACDGAVAGEVAEALAGILEAHGFSKSGRFGYSTGIAYPPDWGEHTLSIRAGETRRLAAGMTLFFIPGLWGVDWSVVLGETFVVKSGSAERLGNLPYRISNS